MDTGTWKPVALVIYLSVLDLRYQLAVAVCCAAEAPGPACSSCPLSHVHSTHCYRYLGRPEACVLRQPPG